MSQTPSVTHSLTERLALSAIYLLFVDRFRRSLLFCHLKFNKEAISDGIIAHSRILVILES